MTNINISKFRENLYSYVKNAIDFNDVIGINTKNGRAIVMSEEDYSGIMETLYLMQFPGTMKEIKEGLETDIKDCVSEKEFEW